MEGSFILRPSPPEYEELLYGPGPPALASNRLGLTFHVGWFDFGGQVALGETLPAGPTLALSIPTRTRMRSIRLEAGSYFWSYERYAKAQLDVSLRATFQTKRDGARTYAEYRARLPATAAPAAPPPDADTGVAPERVLDEATWEQREALYRERKIGVWRGVVWPYANTFGFFTTLLIPAGTSCLGVGEYGPGFALLGGWSALVGYTLFAEGAALVAGASF